MSATEEPEVPESAPGVLEPVPDDPLHSEAWMIAFEEALKEPRFYERLVLYARGRTGYVRIHHNVDDDYAANLVADIIDDVFESVLDWNPERIPLRYFIQREIRLEHGTRPSAPLGVPTMTSTIRGSRRIRTSNPASRRHSRQPRLASAPSG